MAVVQDYCEGGTLQDYIQTAHESGVPLPEERILELFTQIALALRYVHAHRILHRDLKTANIFLTEEGTVKVSRSSPGWNTFAFHLSSRVSEVLLLAPSPGGRLWHSGSA